MKIKCVVKDCLFEPGWHSDIFGFVCDYHLHHLADIKVTSVAKFQPPVYQGVIKDLQPEVGRMSQREPNLNPCGGVGSAVLGDRRSEIREEGPIPPSKSDLGGDFMRGHAAGAATRDAAADYIEHAGRHNEMLHGLTRPEAEFFKAVRTILSSKARSKGYAPIGGDGSDLAAFVERHAPGHAQGEIIYKVVRWNAQHDPTDLVKIAAWAYLIWSGAQPKQS